MPNDNRLREELYKEVMTLLGDGMIDVELGKRQLKMGLDYALRVYRQKASNATEERGIIFKHQEGVQDYDMSASDIEHIEGIYRNTIGASAATDYTMDPFMMMYTNQMMSALNQNMTYGSIATIHLQYNYIDTLEKLTASRIQFYWNPSTKFLSIFNMVKRDEVFLIVANTHRSDEELLNDVNIRSWLLEYATARCKWMLGEARSKFQTLGGPAGGVTLNGNEMKQEAMQELERLEEDLKNFITSDRGYGFHVG